MLLVGRCLFLLFLIISTGKCLNNGLAITPPMGWMAWERFRCIIDCKNYPDECISERLFMRMADSMAEEGYADAGYEYVIIDDCWMATERDSEGRLQPDPQRFPNGIKALADYVHSKGLKFGIYEDYGNLTCGGYPGILGHLQVDAETFENWDVDYVKLDGCYSELEEQEKGYEEFGEYLNATGRPMVYSCSWPAYHESSGINSNFTTLKRVCNLWRNWYDIQDSWNSVSEIMKWYSDNQDRIAVHAGPGHWNDPDMIIIGNYGLSLDQSRSQMAIWAILAAPLIMSVDLAAIRPEFKSILLNKGAIAINQDSMGIQGKLVYTENDIQVWLKPLSKEAYAIAALSQRTDGHPYPIKIKYSKLQLEITNDYRPTNVFEPLQEIISDKDGVAVRVNPTGVVLLRIDKSGRDGSRGDYKNNN